jgi:hypothetical protein
MQRQSRRRDVVSARGDIDAADKQCVLFEPMLTPSTLTMSRKTLLVLSAGLCMFGALTPASVAVADPRNQCHAAKLKESARYASCRLRAEAKGVGANASPNFNSCESRFRRFAGFETKAGPGVCRTERDEGTVNAAITRDTTELAVRLAGGTVEECPSVCEPKAQQKTKDTFQFEDCVIAIALDPCSGTPGEATVVTGGCYVSATPVQNLQLIVNGTPQPVTIASGWASSGGSSCTTRFYPGTAYTVCTCTSSGDPSPPCP